MQFHLEYARYVTAKKRWNGIHCFEYDVLATCIGIKSYCVSRWRVDISWLYCKTRPMSEVSNCNSLNNNFRLERRLCRLAAVMQTSEFIGHVNLRYSYCDEVKGILHFLQDQKRCCTLANCINSLSCKLKHALTNN